MRRNPGTVIMSAVFMLIIGSGCEPQGGGGTGYTNPKIEVVRQKYLDNVIPHPHTLDAAGLQYYWVNQNGVEMRAGERGSRFFVIDDYVYLMTSRNTVYVCDVQLGIYRWRAEIGSPNEYLYSPTSVPDVRMPVEVAGANYLMSPPGISTFDSRPGVAFCSGNRCTLFDCRNGRVIRHYQFEGFASPARPAIGPNGIHLYVPSAARECHKVNLACLAKTHAVRVEGYIKTPLAVYAGKLYAATREGSVTCIDLEAALRTRWVRNLGTPIVHEFLVNDNGMFIAAADQHVYCLNPGTGLNRWVSVFLGGRPAGASQMSENSLYQLIDSVGLVALDLQTGKVKWTNRNAVRVVAADYRTVWLLDRQKNLQIVDETTGKVEKSLSLAGFDFIASNSRVPIVFTANRDGKFFCINRKASGRINRQMVERQLNQP